MNTPSRDNAPPSQSLQSPASPAPAASRRRFLRRSALVAGAGVVAGAGYLVYRGGEGRQLMFATLEEALREVERLAAAGARSLETAAAWSWSQTLVHCAQSIEYSMAGFPEPRSALFQNTLGAAAFQVFSLRGRMSHNLTEPIPGAPALDAPGLDASAALARLRRAAQGFAQHAGAQAPHFAYGSLSKAQYEQAHAMHLANHLSVFDVQG
jgi:hypothetical protein